MEQAMKDLLKIAEQESLNFFKRRFAESGFIDQSFAAWQKRKMDSRPGGAILVQTGKLRNATHVSSRGPGYSIIANYIPYAQIHNEGFDGTEQVRAHSRKTFKQMMVEHTSAKTFGDAV